MIDWKPIETLVDEKDYILLWVTDRREPRAVFGSTYKYPDGTIKIRGDSMRGEWEFSHWAEVNPPPKDIQG